MGGHLQIAKVINFNLKLLCTYLYVYFCACTSDAASWTLGPLDLNSGPLSCWTGHIFHCATSYKRPAGPRPVCSPTRTSSNGTQLSKGTSGVVANCVGCSQDPTSERALFLPSSSPQHSGDQLLASSHSIGVVAAPCMWDNPHIGVAVAP